MLQTLKIKNFIFIDTVELDFHSRFNVLTGETGAGKSIIIDALSLLLGKSASDDYIKSNTDTCEIEGIFKVIPQQIAAEYHDLLSEENELIIYRRLSRTEGNRIKINQQSVPLKTLKSLMKSVADIIGQHEHMSLLTPENQAQMLDNTNKKIQPILQNYQSVYADWKAIESQLKSVETNQQEKSNRLDFLSFQIQEIDTHRFTPEEEDLLKTQKTELKQIQKHRDALSQLQQASEHIQSACTTALSACRIFDTSLQNSQLHSKSNPTSNTPPSLQDTFQAITLQNEIIADTIATHQHRIENLASQDINDIENRLDIIFKCKTKYRCQTLSELLLYRDKIKQEKQALENAHTTTETLLTQKQNLESQLQNLADTLHKLRHESAQKLSKEIETKLQALQFNHCKVDIQVTSIPNEWRTTGTDSVSLWISPNPPEPLKPIEKIASGGELSRIMLAIRTIFQEENPVQSVVFDEIDTGIGGLTANTVGDYLAQIAKRTQVFCITHLPQIAKQADRHFRVEKIIRNNQTQIQCSILSNTERQDELHRMIGGKEMEAFLQKEFAYSEQATQTPS